MKWLVVAAVFAALDVAVAGDIWAVLVAGSSNWYNYRHQADICHAYQILHSHGVPDDHIIVMMADDIADSPENPTPGVIINRPNGTDVYKGVPKDYTGIHVTPHNFLSVLHGDADAVAGIGSGKVLKSGPNDTVFINLVDHGAPGIFGFPHGFLYAKDFVKAIHHMNHHNMYKEMVIYLEACESGSMFTHLPKDIKVIGLSASNAHESSYACYLDEKRHTFLGDVFSVKWMEDTDRENVTAETLQKQYELVKNETTTSHVLQWGDASLQNITLSSFLGAGKPNNTNFGPFPPQHDPCLNSSVSGVDAPLAALQSNVIPGLIGSDYWQYLVSEMKQNRTFVQTVTRGIAVLVTGDDGLADRMMTEVHPITDDDCHAKTTAAFHALCFDLAENPYALSMVQALVNLCEHGYEADVIQEAQLFACTHEHVTGIN